MAGTESGLNQTSLRQRLKRETAAVHQHLRPCVMPGGAMKYDGALDGTPVKVSADCAARDLQMIYAVSIPDPERQVMGIGTQSI